MKQRLRRIYDGHWRMYFHYDNGEPGGVFLGNGRATLTESDDVEHAEPVFLRSGQQGSWNEAFVADPFVLRIPQ